MLQFLVRSSIMPKPNRVNAAHVKAVPVTGESELSEAETVVGVVWVPLHFWTD